MAWREVRRTRSSAAAAAAIDQNDEQGTTTVLTIVYSDGTNQTCLAANSRRASFDCVSCVQLQYLPKTYGTAGKMAVSITKTSQ